MKNAALAGVVFFIMTLLAKDVTAIGFQIWYRMNISYVSKTLCENRSRPKLQCNGKCHLAKQLAKTEGEKSGKEKSPPLRLKLKNLECIAYTEQHVVLAEAFSRIQVHCYSYPVFPRSQFPDSAEHPPNGRC